MSRKRRRSQVISADEQYNEKFAADAEINGEGHDSAEWAKERETWDAFKEEHHEGTPITGLSDRATC